MQQASLSRIIGSIFLIVGTEIGAGVLALPILLSKFGIFTGTLTLIIAWAIMLYTGLLLAKINLTLPEGSNFAAMSGSYLGRCGRIFVSLIFFLTLSSIAMAYISASGSAFGLMLRQPPQAMSIIFVIIFGLIVIWGTRAVDYANRALLTTKLLIFLFVIILLFKTLKATNVFYTASFDGMLAQFPAIMTAFILHNIIPTIRKYLGSDQKALQKSIIIGSIIPLLIYFLWILSVIGNIPQVGENSFAALIARGKDANVGNLLALIIANTHNNIITAFLDTVAAISITTSFLGTSISLYHFIQDFFIKCDKKLVRDYFAPIIFTFMLPLLIVLTKPDIFITALDYAGVGASILFVIIPAIMAFRLKLGKQPFSLGWQGNPILLSIALLVGAGIIVIEIMSQYNH